MPKMSAVVLLLLSGAARAAVPLAPADPDLKKTEAAAVRAVEAHDKKQASLKAYQDLKRLRQDLSYIASEIDRERVGSKQDLATYSQGCLARLEYLKTNGRLDPRLYDPNELPPHPDKVMTRLEKMCRELPSKTYAAEYPRSLIKAIATELRDAAENGKNENEILAILKEHLVLPDQMPGEEDALSSLALFPTDLTLPQFLKLGAIRIFLVKHRIRRPKSHTLTDAKSIVAGRHNVQIGVEIEGRVVRDSGAIDGDYTFDIGDLHIEMTPEWRLLHPNIHKPKKGERIRVRGWTYFDSFHKAEFEYDPADPVLGISRVTLWEIHPVQDVELLP